METPIPRPVERLLLITLVLASAPVRSEDSPAPGTPAPSAATLAAVDRGLAYLANTQEPDGSWEGRVGRKVHTRYIGHEAPHVGITAIAGLSFLSRSGSAAHRDAARRALRWIVDQSREDGFIATHGSRMYSHAFATVFLARALRSDLAPVPGLKEGLQDAAGLIVLVQNAEGGWRYLPGAADSDISVTACQVMALREARDAGIEIPDGTFEHAATYVQRSFAPVASAQPPLSGGFYYQLPGTAGFGPRQSFPLAAAGVAALADAGRAESPEAAAGRRYLLTYRPVSEKAASRFDYYYGHFHAMTALRSEAAGYAAWRDAAIRELRSLQSTDGSWSDLVGPAYATAMATLILQEALIPPARGAEGK